ENKYNAILGGGKSNYVHPSDLAPMLIAMDATATIVGPGGTRTAPLQEFFVLPSKDVRRENILDPGEIVTQVNIPASPLTGRSHYPKFKERESMDFALSAVGAAVELAGDQAVRQCRIVLGGVATIPWRTIKAEQYLAGNPLTDKAIAQAAEIALEDAEPMG